MKNILFFIIFLSSISAISQDSYEGTFWRANLVDTYESIKFNNDGTFEYKKGGDLGDPKPSKGEYQFLDDLLILNFNNSQSKKLGFHKTDIWRNQNDSVMVNFKVMDHKGNPLEHAWVYNANSKSQIRTDNNGTANIRLEKENNTSDFIITWIGFERYDLKVDLNYNQKVEIYLTEDLQDIPIRNQIDTLKVTELHKTYFVTDGSIKWEKSD
ncbi:hypothetical protein [Salinimicrobium sp. HB62]|uniref:hypothetical protein n=1 Tax=Salinimicrobium sp. HB62 TaxID=3077781 RepID=UPI002D79C6FF|nr:hypothetical protein [Salinimicrobium sp. HB62]